MFSPSETTSPRSQQITDPDISSILLAYRCIHCGTPNSTLYKTKPSLQLSPCRRCFEYVDLYCEYEPTLIALDLVLLRPEAYRHVLWNHDMVRHIYQSSAESHPDKEQNDYSTVTMASIYGLILLSSCLQTYLVASIHFSVSDDDAERQSPQWLHYVTTSLIRHLLVLVGTFALRLWWAKGSVATVESHPRLQSLYDIHWLWQRTVLALVLPHVALQWVTSCVLLWDNCLWVRQLGSLLTVMYQSMAIHASSGTNEGANAVLALGVANFVAAVLMVILQHAGLVVAMGCLGWEAHVLPRGLFGSAFDTLFEVDDSFSLCLFG